MRWVAAPACVAFLMIHLATLTTVAQSPEEDCRTPWGACPLLEASAARVAQRAVDYSWGTIGLPTGGVCVLRGQPEVVLVRGVTFTELETLGIAPTAGPAFPLWNRVAADRSRPLYLVILRGAFHYAGDFARGEYIGPPVEEMVVTYIAQVLDAETGRLVWTETSRLGGRFREALADHMLLDDPPSPRALSLDNPLSCQQPPAPPQAR